MNAEHLNGDAHTTIRIQYTRKTCDRSGEWWGHQHTRHGAEGESGAGGSRLFGSQFCAGGPGKDSANCSTSWGVAASGGTPRPAQGMDIRASPPDAHSTAGGTPCGPLASSSEGDDQVERVHEEDGVWQEREQREEDEHELLEGKRARAGGHGGVEGKRTALLPAPALICKGLGGCCGAAAVAATGSGD